MNIQKKIFFMIIFLMMSYSRMMAGGSTSSGTPVKGTQPATSNRATTTAALSSPNKAYGDNMKEVEPGVFAIYSGDVSQDGYIAVDDVAQIDNDNLVGAFGPYLLNDLNGDTYVGVDDVAMCDNNNLIGIQIQRP